MRYLHTLTLLSAFLALGAVTPNSAAAQDPGATVVAMLKQRDAKIQTLVSAHPDTSDKSFRDELKVIINQDFDFAELSKRALGRQWRGRTEAEQKDFIETFSRIVKNSSVRKLDVYRADRIEYGETRLARGSMTVPTTVYKKDANKTIEYKLHEVDGQWKMYDLVIDEVSTARNYRDAFYKEIDKNGWDGMMDKLRKRLEEDEEAGDL